MINSAEERGEKVHADERDLLLEKLISAPQDREMLLEQYELTEEDREEIHSLLNVADELWVSAQSAPPLEDDPVAAMLGLVPEVDFALDAKSLTKLRKRSLLTVSELAERLRKREWEVQGNDVFRWESGASLDVSPAMMEAVAAVLGAPVSALASTPTTTNSFPTYVREATKTPKFKQLAERWAQLRHISINSASTMLERRMLASVHRGDKPDAELLLHALDALVNSLEQDTQ